MDHALQKKEESQNIIPEKELLKSGFKIDKRHIFCNIHPESKNV